MNFLLDTHIIIWWNEDSSKLTAKARSLIQNLSNTKFVSTVSIWEIAIKVASGKLILDIDELLKSLDEDGFVTLPFEHHHAKTVADLPKHHGDPFDKALVAQSLAESFQLLTHDKILSKYGKHIVLV